MWHELPFWSQGMTGPRITPRRTTTAATPSDTPKPSRYPIPYTKKGKAIDPSNFGAIPAAERNTEAQRLAFERWQTIAQARQLQTGTMHQGRAVRIEREAKVQVPDSDSSERDEAEANALRMRLHKLAARNSKRRARRARSRSRSRSPHLDKKLSLLPRPAVTAVEPDGQRETPANDVLRPMNQVAPTGYLGRAFGRPLGHKKGGDSPGSPSSSGPLGSDASSGLRDVFSRPSPAVG